MRGWLTGAFLAAGFVIGLPAFAQSGETVAQSSAVQLAAPVAAAAAPVQSQAAPATPLTAAGAADRLESARLGPTTDAVSDARVERARLKIEAGVRFENGEGMERDYGKALNMYCDAARVGVPDAFIRIGWLYANGLGVPRSEAVAQTLFRRAAGLGSEMGARLADLFMGQPSRMPPCLGGDPLPVDPPPVAKHVDLTPTPQVVAPAQFRAAPPPIERRKVVEMVVRLAAQLKLDPRLVLAVIGTESGYDPLARSVKNAQGLMQLIPDTAERFAVKDILDPLENLRGGMSYLRWLLSYYRGDVWLAVAAYNAGEGAVDKYRGVPPYAETMAYVQRIRNQYPIDRHPFDPRAAGPSGMFNGKRIGPTTAADRVPRS